MTVTFYIITNEAGGEAVLPAQHRVLQIHRHSLAKAEKETDEAVATRIREQADEAYGLWKEMAAQATERTFEIKPYTWGQKRLARKAATTWQGDSTVFDDAIYYAELVKASASLTDDQLAELSPGLGAMLLDEVVDLSEPDPAKLHFLYSSQPGCETTRN